MKSTSAIILAGGKGKRMDMFCEHRPKPILPFAGKHRVIDLTLNNCLKSQIGNLAVLVDYQRTSMADYLRKWHESNKSAFGISILPPGNGSYNGTANAVYQNLNYLKNQENDDVLILAGDHIYDMDYRNILAAHAEKKANVTVALTQVPLDEAHRFGTACVGADGKIEEFVEKSSTPKSDLASMGIYVFNRRFLIEQLEEDAHNPNSTHDFGYSVIPNAIRDGGVFGFYFRDYWQDIGTIESYYHANMRLLAEKRGDSFKNMKPVYSFNERMSLSVVNVPGYIVNSLVSPGCSIQGYVENSILSPGVCIGENARVVNSIVMANSRIGKNSVVERSILDEEVDIDKFCYVGFGGISKTEMNEITLVGKGVSLGPNTSIGKKSKIMPGLRLANLNCRFVAPGTTVMTSV